MNENVTEISGWVIIAVPLLLIGAICFFRWMYDKINGIEPKEVTPKEVPEEESYLGENLLRGFVFIVYILAMVISEDRRHSQILTFSALALSWLISWAYKKRRKEDAAERIREEQRAQGIYEGEMDVEPSRWGKH